jgi:hypothetical protein
MKRLLFVCLLALVFVAAGVAAPKTSDVPDNWVVTNYPQKGYVDLCKASAVFERSTRTFIWADGYAWGVAGLGGADDVVNLIAANC